MPAGGESTAPLVTIGLPVYKGERYLADALSALLAQELRDFELLVSDNASTDGTERIARAFASGDGRIRYHRNAANIGAAGNFNRVAGAARGRYFVWASCHDRWAPGFLSRCVGEMEADESVVLCYPATTIIDASGKVVHTADTGVDTRGLPAGRRYLRVIRSCQPHAIYGVHRLAALRRVLPTRRALGPDDLVQAELALLGAFAFVPEVLFSMRRLGDFGSWRRYFAKLGIDLRGLAGLSLCADYVRHHMDIIRRRVPDRGRRLRLSLETAAVLPLRSWPVFAAIVLDGAWPELAGLLRARLRRDR